MSSLEQIIDNTTNLSGIIIMDFYASWCPPCLKFMPTFEEIAEEFSTKNSGLKFWIINVEKNTAFAQQHKIKGIPTIKIFKDGIVLDSISGVHEKSEVISWINHVCLTK